MIIRIKSEQVEYRVGHNGVTEIIETEHGGEKMTIYEIKYGDSYTFVGLLHPHTVERAI